MKISMLQARISWEKKHQNLKKVHDTLKILQGETDLLVLPEMFSTGFSMNVKELSEPVSGETITKLTNWACKYGIAIAGSFMATENGKYYNRAFFITPEKETYFYDKKHLFRMGNEIDYYTPGDKKVIIPYRGWNICLMVCYDLRFPVWSRNVNNEYDLLIYVANWPESRHSVWKTMLFARALENICYVCGVNRIGKDGNNIPHLGESMIITPKGSFSALSINQEGYFTKEIDLDYLREFREKFPAWKDADKFTIN